MITGLFKKETGVIERLQNGLLHMSLPKTHPPKPEQTTRLFDDGFLDLEKADTASVFAFSIYIFRRIVGWLVGWLARAYPATAKAIKPMTSKAIPPSVRLTTPS